MENLLDKIAKIVEPIIEDILSSYVDKKNRGIVSYQIKTGGKRLRPALAIICCQMLGGKLKDIIYPAAGLEILHNWSLLVDDIIDKSVLRREKPTPWFKFGKSIGHCLEPYYGAAAFQAANRSKKPVEISELFAKTIKTIFNGEILDILFEQKGREEEPFINKNRYSKVSKNDYFKMIAQKTAVLFETSCQTGGMAANAKEKTLHYLKNFGLNLGMAFQISDDILDIFGKEIGQDIKERKLGNIVVLLSLNGLKPADKERLLKIMRKEKINGSDLKNGVDLIQKTGSREKASLLCQNFVEKAKKNLKFLPKNKWNNTLNDLADFIAKREK